MWLQLVKLLLSIFGVFLEERRKAVERRQQFELDEANMLHISVIAIHRLRESAAQESQAAKEVEERLERETKE